MPNEVRDRVRAILADPAYDDVASDAVRSDAILALCEPHGWDAVLEALLGVLRDDGAQRHWREASIVLFCALPRPMPVNQVIGLLYRRLIEEVPADYELDENLVWSITRNLKNVDYLSEYEPLQDPAIQAEMKRQP
jgi:hypothetical protein